MQEGFVFQQVIPQAMHDVHFNEQSLWNKSEVISIPKNGHSIVLAPSGSGKTSLLTFMYGIRTDFNGALTFNQKQVKELQLSDWSKIRQRQLSVIFQDLRLIPHLTVAENLRLKNNLTTHKTVEEIQHMLASLEIENKWNQTCGTLSFGQQQRVCIVRALLQPFDFLLADEPFSHIDDSTIEKAKNLLLAECKHNNASLILFSLGQSYNISFNQQYHL